MEEEGGFRDYLMDIDNVNFEITGFTMDISNISRRDLDFYYDEELMYGYKFKRHASYQKDQEVISTESGELLGVIDTPQALSLIRFLFLLRVCGRSGQFDKIMPDIIGGRYSEMIPLCGQEKETVAWIADNLWGEWLDKERGAYHKMFNGLNSHGRYTWFQHWNGIRDGKDLPELLQRLAYVNGLFPDSGLLAWMRQKAGI